MNGDILKQTAPRATGPKPPKEKKVSAVAVILTIILAIVIILLGERIIFDLNRAANPLVEDQSDLKGYHPDYRSGLIYELSALSDIRVYYPQEKKGEYLLYKLLIHGAFIIPAFLLVFILYYLVFLKAKSSNYKILVGGYLVFGFWMILRLLIEIAHFIVVQYKSAAIYIILVTLAVIFTVLVLVIQKKLAQKTN